MYEMCVYIFLFTYTDDVYIYQYEYIVYVEGASPSQYATKRLGNTFYWLGEHLKIYEGFPPTGSN